MELSKTLGNIKNYLVDTTSLLILSNPMYASLETFISGMDVKTSLESRIKVSLLAYTGLGFLYVKGRDFSKKVFKVNEKSSEKTHALHDSLYNVTFNVSASFPIYLTSGANMNQATVGAIGAGILGLISGPINGISIDLFRDFMGTKETKRNFPEKLKKAQKSTKRFLAAGMIGLMLTSTAGVYSIKNKYFNEDSPKQKIEYQEKNLERKIQ